MQEESCRRFSPQRNTKDLKRKDAQKFVQNLTTEIQRHQVLFFSVTHPYLISGQLSVTMVNRLWSCFALEEPQDGCPNAETGNVWQEQEPTDKG